MDKKEIIKLIIRKLSFLKKGGEFAVAKEIVGLDEKIFKIDYKISKIAETVDEEINKIYSDLESKLEKTNYEKIDREEIAKEVMKEVLNNIEIPEPKNGEDGKDYILTEKDKKEIATKIKVPIVEKIIEHTEVIKEQPVITNEIKEVAKYQTGEQIVDKININTKLIKREKVEGFDDLERIVRESNAKLYTGISETRALELIKKNPIDVSNFELELARKITGNSYRDEPTITDGHITEVIYWTNSSMTTKLFTKSLTWTDGKPTEIITTDEVTGKILTTTLDWSGTYPTVTKVIS